MFGLESSNKQRIFKKYPTGSEFTDKKFIAALSDFITQCTNKANKANKANKSNAPINAPTIDEILQFWYGKLPNHNTLIDINRKKKWFNGGKDFDNEIKQKYGEFMKKVLNDKQYDKEWRKTPKGCLALILIADQFTRNVYRNTSKMYEYDSYAQELCLYAIDNKYDEALYKMHPSYCSHQIFLF